MSDTPAPKPELEASGRDAARDINASKGNADVANMKDAADRTGISKTLASAKSPFEEDEETNPKKPVVVTEVAVKDGVTQEAAPKPIRPSVPPRPGPARGAPLRTTGAPAATKPSTPPRAISSPPGAALPAAPRRPSVAPPPAAPVPAEPPAAAVGAALLKVDPISPNAIAAMPIITLGTASNQDKDSVAIASSGIRRSSIPPPPALDPTPSPLGSDGGISLSTTFPPRGPLPTRWSKRWPVRAPR